MACVCETRRRVERCRKGGKGAVDARHCGVRDIRGSTPRRGDEGPVKLGRVALARDVGYSAGGVGHLIAHPDVASLGDREDGGPRGDRNRCRRPPRHEIRRGRLADGVIDVGLGEGAWGEEETQSPRRQRHGHVEYYSKI